MSGYIGTQPVPQATQTRDKYTATFNQTSFGTGGYTVGFLDVFVNGIHLVDGIDYTATNGSDVVLAVGAASGDNVEVISFGTFDVANTLAPGGSAANLTDIPAANLTGALPAISGAALTALPANAILQNGDAGLNSIVLAGISSVKALRETVDIIETTTGVISYDVTQQGVQFYSVDQTANRTINFTNANANLAIGQSVTMLIAMKQGAAPYYLNVYQVDGTAVYPAWSGTAGPTEGTANTLAAYSFTLIKIADATFQILAAVQSFTQSVEVINWFAQTATDPTYSAPNAQQAVGRVGTHIISVGLGPSSEGYPSVMRRATTTTGPWTQTTFGTALLDEPQMFATDGSGTAIIVTNNGRIHRSTDGNGATWTQTQQVSTSSLRGVKYMHSAFWAWGNSSSLWKSSNGLSFSQVTTGIASNPTDLASDGSRMIFVSQGGHPFVYSDDGGVSWSNGVNINGTSDLIEKVLYGGDNWMAIGSRKVWTSTDSSTWTDKSSAIPFTASNPPATGEFAEYANFHALAYDSARDVWMFWGGDDQGESSMETANLGTTYTVTSVPSSDYLKFLYFNEALGEGIIGAAFDRGNGVPQYAMT